MNSAARSRLLSILGGMMAAAYLHGKGIVDLSRGFSAGGIVEGGLMALTGGVAGYLVLFAFRKMRDITGREQR